MNNQLNYTLITTYLELAAFYETHQSVSWIAFDTEFISEMRYYPQLCLIQVASEHGLFLIDTLALDDILLFLKLIEDAAILKITHAGDNDYRLFYALYNTIPKNVYDVQIGAGFIGYRYPMALGSLLKEELRIQISKNQKVSNWAERPISKAQINYALVDVIHLKALYDSINTKLEEFGRKKYAIEEMSILEQPAFYQADFRKNLSNNITFMSLSRKSKVFYIRLYNWREERAERKNLSRNMIMDNKTLVYITKNISFGINQLNDHRRIPGHLVKNYGQKFMAMYEEQASDEEVAFLKTIPKPSKNYQQQDLLFNQIDLYIQYIGDKYNISPSLLFSRTELNKIKQDPNFPVQELVAGWRKELLGEDILKWLTNQEPLKMVFKEGKLTIGF